MKPFLEAILLLWLTASAATAMAQDPADAAPAGAESADEQTAADAVADEQTGAAALPGEPPVELEPDPGALVEEDARVAASAEEEFDPDEEISEDYPVPLPSDI